MIESGEIEPLMLIIEKKSVIWQNAVEYSIIKHHSTKHWCLMAWVIEIKRTVLDKLTLICCDMVTGRNAVVMNGNILVK